MPVPLLWWEAATACVAGLTTDVVEADPDPLGDATPAAAAVGAMFVVAGLDVGVVGAGVAD
jgi:hypothetical protein